MVLKQEDFEHLTKRSKDDLISMIVTLASEKPEIRALVNSPDQKKAAGRIVTIQLMQRAIRRLKASLTRKDGDVRELLAFIPKEHAEVWLRAKKAQKAAKRPT